MNINPAVLVANEQDEIAIDTERFLALANDVLIDEQVGSEVEVSVRYVDEKTMAELNERFMGKVGPTDVLSFPIDEGTSEVGRFPDNGGTGPGSTAEDDEVVPSLLGDIVICPAVAKSRAPHHAGDFEDELALLLVHGLLHLLGMDHEDENDAEAMEDREKELLETFWRPLPDTAWPEHRGEHSDT